MITSKQLSTLENARQRYLEGLPGAAIDDACVADILTMLGDMALRNEILRAELEEMKRHLKNQATGRAKA